MMKACVVNYDEGLFWANCHFRAMALILEKCNCVNYRAKLDGEILVYSVS